MSDQKKSINHCFLLSKCFRPELEQLTEKLQCFQLCIKKSSVGNTGMFPSILSFLVRSIYFARSNGLHIFWFDNQGTESCIERLQFSSTKLENWVITFVEFFEVQVLTMFKYFFNFYKLSIIYMQIIHFGMIYLQVIFYQDIKSANPLPRVLVVRSVSANICLRNP